VEAVREAQIPDGALPQIHISGCPSSCGTHQTGALGFRGGSKKVDGKQQSAFVLYINGEQRQGQETMGSELGAIEEKDIPGFLVELGQTVAASGMSFEAWNRADAQALERIAAGYLE
jgi:ferredoxin-nitrite reductase